MFLIWIGWLYVIFMLSLAQGTIVRGVLFFIVLGLIPSILLAWLARRKQRRKKT